MSSKKNTTALSRLRSEKQRAFAEAYIGQANFNATEAARLAGYAGNDNTLSSIGYENLRKPEIQKAITELMERRLMEEREAQHRLSAIARASMADFLSEGEDGSLRLDLEKARERGALVAIRSVKFDEAGRVVDFKLHDALKVLTYLFDYFRHLEETRDPEDKARKDLKSALEKAGIDLDPNTVNVSIRSIP